MHRALEPRCELLQVEKIERVVFLSEEARRAIIAALDYMDRYITKHEASTARHASHNERTLGALTRLKTWSVPDYPRVGMVKPPPRGVSWCGQRVVTTLVRV